jgi:hypothetical protein
MTGRIAVLLSQRLVQRAPSDVRNVRVLHTPAGSVRAGRGGIDQPERCRRTAAFHGFHLESGHSAFGQKRTCKRSSRTANCVRIAAVREAPICR